MSDTLGRGLWISLQLFTWPLLARLARPVRLAMPAVRLSIYTAIGLAASRHHTNF